MKVELTARFRDMTFDGKGKAILSFTVEEDCSEWLDTVRDKDLTMTVKEKKQKRSKNANDYFWELCTRIAESQGVPKEEVYRHEIRAVGVCERLSIRSDALQRFTEAWGSRGIGWVVDVVDQYEKGFTMIFAYYGSSTYDSAEMSRLIDNTVQDAKALGIPTEPPEIQALLLENWK